MTLRHSWGEAERPSIHRTLRRCVTCGMLKITRHEGDNHWIEFWRGTEELKGPRTPACERGEEAGASTPHPAHAPRESGLSRKGRGEGAIAGEGAEA